MVEGVLARRDFFRWGVGWLGKSCVNFYTVYVVTVGMSFLWQLYYGIVVALFCCLHSLGGH